MTGEQKKRRDAPPEGQKAPGLPLISIVKPSINPSAVVLKNQYAYQSLLVALLSDRFAQLEQLIKHYT